MKTIEQELKQYVIDNHLKIGRPPGYVGGQQRNDLIAAEDDPLDRIDRNADIILNFFGMGEMFFPTLKELAGAYEGLGTRERCRQLIKQHYTAKIPPQALQIASAVADILEQKTFWLEYEFLRELKTSGLTNGIKTAKQLLNYLTSQELSLHFDVYRPNLLPATRQSYIEGDEHIILLKSRKERLRALYMKSRKFVNRNGLCRITHAIDGISDNDKEALLNILKIDKTVWIKEFDGVLWYNFETHRNTLVNNAGKIFAVVKTCNVNILSTLLTNALKTRASPLNYYPDESLVKEWICTSPIFSVVDKKVELEGSISNLTEIERDIIDAMSEQKAMSFSDIAKTLKKRGHYDDLIEKAIYNSPLVLVDHAKGLHNFILISGVKAN